MSGHKLSTAMYAQGWLEGQLESAVINSAKRENEDPKTHAVSTQVLEQWAVISAAFDNLIKENTELNRKLSIIESAFR
jgi:hypothetical protein